METQIPRIFKAPEDSFFLFGPRGTGKTTFLKQSYKDALWVDLLDPETFRLYSAKPERLIELAEGNPLARSIVIDEVQKLPELLGVVHLLIEKKKGVQFILTGSSSRKLKKSGSDLLAGRVLMRTLHPFIAAEMCSKFSLRDALKTGMLPVVYSSKDPESTIRSYAALYVREEVQAEGLVRNIGNFSRFLEAASFSHGAVLDISNVARECHVERKSVEGYISILEDLLIAYRVPVFTKKAKRRTVSHPKFFYFDAGVFRSLRPAGPLDKPSEIDGAALEGLVAQHLTSWIAYSGSRNRLYYWRTEEKAEVDFVVYGDDAFMAIEVKNSAIVRPEDIKPLVAFKSDYPECEAYLLYRGKEKIKKNGIICMPCEEFLMGLKLGSKKG
jgi:predicted AAA+ superfamily ATPase